MYLNNAFSEKLFLLKSLKVYSNNGHKVRTVVGRNEVRKQQLLTVILCSNIMIDDRSDDTSLSSVLIVSQISSCGQDVHPGYVRIIHK